MTVEAARRTRPLMESQSQHTAAEPARVYLYHHQVNSQCGPSDKTIG
jgi:hypothetical protein